MTRKAHGYIGVLPSVTSIEVARVKLLSNAFSSARRAALSRWSDSAFRGGPSFGKGRHCVWVIELLSSFDFVRSRAKTDNIAPVIIWYKLDSITTLYTTLRYYQPPSTAARPNQQKQLRLTQAPSTWIYLPGNCIYLFGLLSDRHYI